MPPRLSMRVQSLKPSATLAVSNRVVELKQAGREIIDFGLGEPDFVTPKNIRQAAIDALNAGQTHYTPVAGPASAREAIATKLRSENAIECGAGDICISTGAKHSVYLALQCLLDVPTSAGDGGGQEVLLPTPAWVSYAPMAQLAGGTVVEIPGLMDNQFKITPGQLSAAITPRSKVLILNSPSNPCGTMYSGDELRVLGEVLIPHDGITIISDEIYEKLIYSETSHFSIGSIAKLADRVITVNGLSKAYAMTGWRIGYACGKGGFAGAMAKLQGQMTSNITSFCYGSIVEALTNGEREMQSMRAAFSARAALIAEQMSLWPKVRFARPTGAFYVFPDIGAHIGSRTAGGRFISSAVDFAAGLLEEAGVAVVPGEDFGVCARSHVRLSFATSDQNIRMGCERIRHFLESLKQ